MDKVNLNEDEEVRDVLGYVGLYMISNHGRIWSCGREIITTNQYGPCVKYLKAKWLKSIVNIHGYKHVNLYKDGELKNITIHRLVAEAFIPNLLNLPQINHIDGNKKNNHYSNLERVTAQQNINHAMETRLHSPNRSSEYYGVSWYKRDKKWEVNIRIKGKKYHIGHFNNELDAAQAWDMFLKEHNIDDKPKNLLTST